MLSLPERNAIIGDATLIESLIFLEKNTHQYWIILLSQVLPLTWILKPKCVGITSLEESAKGEALKKQICSPQGTAVGQAYSDRAGRNPHHARGRWKLEQWEFVVCLGAYLSQPSKCGSCEKPAKDHCRETGHSRYVPVKPNPELRVRKEGTFGYKWQNQTWNGGGGEGGRWRTWFLCQESKEIGTMKMKLQEGQKGT